MTGYPPFPRKVGEVILVSFFLFLLFSIPPPPQMRSPSIYSQDDPISAALKPPSTETDSERNVRLQFEAEAKRVSEQIDEDLREERERLKKKKGDVKVNTCIVSYPLSFIDIDAQLLLLGQAESGKSTLQKQFQLMYKPTSLDQERSSWKTVIYFNVVHSLKHILTTLENWDDVLEDDDDDTQSVVPTKQRRVGIADQPSPSTSLMNGGDIHGSPSSVLQSEATGSSSGHSALPKDAGAVQIANLRRRLSPLIAAESQLADRLSGGISVSGSGKGSVYVRSGWQARTIGNALGKGKTKSVEKRVRESISCDETDTLVQEVGHLLEVCEGDIKELWSNPTVKGLIVKRRLKLDEWSELYEYLISIDILTFHLI